MTQAADANAKTQEIFEKLKSIGIFAGGTTGSVHNHSVPKVDSSTEKRAAEQIDLEAKQNQLFYLAKSEESGKPWFQCVKENRQYSEFVLVTPEMAKELLKFNVNPRKRIKQARVESYAKDMLSNNWIDTAESIAIDLQGTMHNGQHRINAVIRVGKPQRLYFTFNTLARARLAEDSGIGRSATEILDLEITNNLGTKLAAICRSCMRGVSGINENFTHSEISNFAKKYGQTIEWVVRICPGHRSDILAVFVKAALWYGPDRIEPFIKRFSDVMFISVNDPARRLHDLAKLSKGCTRVSLYKKSLAAVNHYLQGNEIAKLMERDKDIFEWDADWSIPSKT